MDFEYDPDFRHLPQTELHGVEECDAEADRVRTELGWKLATFTAVFDIDLEWVLLVQLGDYSKKLYGANCWCLPGGGVEDNELPSIAALRELKEETNIDLDSVGELRPAGWFARPYYKPHNRDVAGELLILHAVIANPDDPALKPSPPETLQASYYPFSLDAFLGVPTRGEGEHPLQPMANHWGWWVEAGKRSLENQLAEPTVWTYETKEMLQHTPWPTPPSVVREGKKIELTDD